MPTLPFTKGHGTGNDFVLLADPDGELTLSDDQVTALCDRRFGIGGDGILRVVRSAAVADGVTTAAGAEWFMDYRNADGSAAEMCGNGIRVFARYLSDTGLVEFGDVAVPIGTRSGVKHVTVSDRGFEVDLGAWTVDESDIRVRAKGLIVPRPGLGIDLGNPHVVVALPSIDDLEEADLSYVPVLEPAPPRGANVEFVVPEDPLVRDGVGSIRMRVHERGVGETLSCGTGVAAAAVATRHWAGPGAPDLWRVEVPGGELDVRMHNGHVLLSGPAALVYSGEITLRD